MTSLYLTLVALAAFFGSVCAVFILAIMVLDR